MRGLKLKLNLQSSNTEVGMSDFQMYIIREREAYLKNLNDHSQINYHVPEYHDPHPLSMSQIKGTTSANNPTPYDKRKVGLLNSVIGHNSSSQGSLHYVSKNLSSPNSNNY